MKENNESQIIEAELIPSTDMILRSGIDKAMLDRIVKQKVAEIMAERDALVFEPFFRSRQVAYELKRLQSVPEQQKWAVSFERYGCMVCETRERIHAGNGLCGQCRALWFRRLGQIIAEGITGQTASPSRNVDDPLKPQALLPVVRAHRRWNKPRNRKPNPNDVA